MRNGKTLRALLFAALFIVLSSGCSSSTADYRSYTSFNAAWPNNSPAEFTLANLEGNYDVFIHLRNDNNYPFSNIFIIAEWEADAVLQSTDTLEYQMSSPEGKWLGTGFTEVKESKLYWKQRQRLYDSVRYTVRLRHALREIGQAQGIEELTGILAVGIAAEKRP